MNNIPLQFFWHPRRKTLRSIKTFKRTPHFDPPGFCRPTGQLPRKNLIEVAEPRSPFANDITPLTVNGFTATRIAHLDDDKQTARQDL
jgi:hypothetical protein